MDKFEKRIKGILGPEISHNKKNTKKYYHYLAKSIQLPCQLTGREDFPWEEPYVFGGWSKKEYEKLKKDKPSYTDKYELLEILEPEDEDIFVKLKRIKDNKEFEIGLDWLKCINPKNRNYLLIEDYAVWYVNY